MDASSSSAPSAVKTPAAMLQDVPSVYRLPVIRARIAIEEMRAALYDENPAGDPCAQLRAIECRELIAQFRELAVLLRECRAVEAEVRGRAATTA